MCRQWPFILVMLVVLTGAAQASPMGWIRRKMAPSVASAPTTKVLEQDEIDKAANAINLLAAVVRDKGTRKEKIARKIEVKGCNFHYSSFIGGLKDKDNSGEVDFRYAEVKPRLLSPTGKNPYWGISFVADKAALNASNQESSKLLFMEGNSQEGMEKRNQLYGHLQLLSYLCRGGHADLYRGERPPLALPSSPVPATMEEDNLSSPPADGNPKSCFRTRAPLLSTGSFGSGIDTGFYSSFYERLLFEKINQFRVEKGLAPLIYSPALSAIAREHSRYLAQNNLGANHRFVNYRYRKAWTTIPWIAAGENVAYNKGSESPVDKALTQWQRSWGHRRLMLKDWSKSGGKPYAGLGIAHTKDGRFYFTQFFLESKKGSKLDESKQIDKNKNRIR